MHSSGFPYLALGGERYLWLFQWPLYSNPDIVAGINTSGKSFRMGGVSSILTGLLPVY
jgi:hypothetical protein